MYEQGYQDALQLLGEGLEKNAFIGKGLRSVGRWAKSKLPTRQGVKQFLVGNPRQFIGEVRQGKAFGKDSLLAESFKAPGTFNKMMFYGLPGYDMARTAFDDQGNKAERMGAQLGGNLLGIAAFRPFGMLGSIGAGIAGDVAGGAIGRGVGKLTGKKEQEPTGNFNPYVY